MMYGLTEDNFSTWAASPGIFVAVSPYYNWNVNPDTSSNIEGFQFLYCAEAANNDFTCYKFNPTSD